MSHSHTCFHFSLAGFETAIHAFVIFRLDYFNYFFVDLPIYSLRPPQLVQNFAASILYRSSNFLSLTAWPTMAF